MITGHLRKPRSAPRTLVFFYSLFSFSAPKTTSLMIGVLVVLILSFATLSCSRSVSIKSDACQYNLTELTQNSFHELHIPFYVITHTPRKAIPERVFQLLKEYECNHLFANLEYEVDELRRDLRIWKLGEKHGIQVNFFHNKNVIEPGVIRTRQGKGYTVGVCRLHGLDLYNHHRFIPRTGEAG